MGQTRTGTIQNNLVSTFLVGGFVSNLGSLVFQIGFAIYAVQIGWPLAFVGLTLALCRYAQTGSNLLWGDLGDRANARSWLIATDIGGGLTDLAMVFISLHFAEFPQSGVLAVLLFRNLAMGLQVPLRAKIGKVLADQNPGASQNIAINLNIVAQGTTLFGAIFVLLLKRQTGFAGICVFDLVTFSLSALSSSLLPGYLFAESETSLRRAWAWKEKFRRYYNFNRGLFWRDVLISFPVWGT